ncbi:cytochrome b-c1 complex subunit 7 [Megalopta genalis]|uniref:cytochrome b-c1 complex subunit 7 n=1 Tax=Megalopta genalis TaxID=115081 RepID=UPI003FCFC8C2
MSRLSSMIKTSRSMFNRASRPGGGVAHDKLKKIAFNLAGWNQYGLYTDDVLSENYPVVREVLRRLPKDVQDARTFRMIRAAQLDFLKTRLPKDEWITFEQDREYRYLKPYLKEIYEEIYEIYEFGCVNYSENDWPAE